MWNNLGILSQVRDELGQAKICVEQPGYAVQVRDEPGQAEIRVEQPGDLYKLEMNLGKQKFVWNNLGML